MIKTPGIWRSRAEFLMYDGNEIQCLLVKCEQLLLRACPLQNAVLGRRAALATLATTAQPSAFGIEKLPSFNYS